MEAGAELALAISSLDSSSSMADSSSVSALATGGGSGLRPSFTARLISAARQAAYRCFCTVSGWGSPNCRRICGRERVWAKARERSSSSSGVGRAVLAGFPGSQSVAVAVAVAA